MEKVYQSLRQVGYNDAMQRFLGHKWVVFGLATVAVIALAVVAAGLPDMQFDPAGQLPFAMPQGEITFEGEPSSSPPFYQTLLFWMALSVVLALLLALFDPESRKKLFQMLLRFGLIALGLYLLLNVVLETGISFGTGGQAGQGESGELLPGVMPSFEMPIIPPWLRFAVATGLVFASFWFFMWAVRQRDRRKKAEMPLEDLADISRDALSQLREGRDWGDAITDCYMRMSRVVSSERGIERQASMTPHEFGLRMQQAGIPAGAVQTLTSLFEEVRYGGRQVSEQKISRATEALQAILRACGGAS